MAVVQISHNTALMAYDIRIEIGIQRIGELRFQSRITLRDIQRVGVVGDDTHIPCFLRLRLETFRDMCEMVE